MKVSFPLSDVLISASITFVALFLFPSKELFSVLLVGGYAHFIAAWLYQWRAGKAPLEFVLTLFVLGGVTAMYFLPTSYMWQIAIVGLVFLAHHFFDEFRLLGFTMTPRRFIESFVPMFLYAAVFITSLFGPGMESSVCVGLAVAAGTVVVGQSVFKSGGYHVDNFTRYMFVISAALAFCLAQGYSFQSYQLMGAVIIYHYCKWYAYSYRRTPPGSPTRTRYVVEMLSINALVLALFLLFRSHLVEGVFFDSLFTPVVFYFVTLLHIISSFIQFGFTMRSTHAIR